jgi:hypothetical protein
MQTATSVTTHEPLCTQKIETDGNIKYLQLYLVVENDPFLEVATALISAILLLDMHLSQTNTSVPRITVSFGTSL